MCVVSTVRTRSHTVALHCSIARAANIPRSILAGAGKIGLYALRPLALWWAGYLAYVTIEVRRMEACGAATDDVCAMSSEQHNWDWRASTLANCVACGRVNGSDGRPTLKCLEPQCGTANVAVGKLLRFMIGDASLPDPPVYDPRYQRIWQSPGQIIISVFVLNRLLTIFLIRRQMFSFGLGLKRFILRSARSLATDALPPQVQGDRAIEACVKAMVHGASVRIVETELISEGRREGMGREGMGSSSLSKGLSSESDGSAIAGAHACVGAPPAQRRSASLLRASQLRISAERLARASISRVVGSFERRTPSRPRRQFIQLSADLGTVRWSWTGYIALEDIYWIDLAPHSAHAGDGGGASWRVLINYGPPWRRRQLELIFPGGKEAYRWARGLESLVRENALDVAPELHHFLMAMFNHADRDGSNTIDAAEEAQLLASLNLGENTRWRRLHTAAVSSPPPLHVAEPSAPSLIRFATFYRILHEFMCADDDAARLYAKYASPKKKIGLEREQFIRLWREEIDAHRQPPPPPVMRTFDQMASHRRAIEKLKFAQGTTKRSKSSSSVALTPKSRAHAPRVIRRVLQPKIPHESPVARRETSRARSLRPEAGEVGEGSQPAMAAASPVALLTPSPAGWPGMASPLTQRLVEDSRQPNLQHEVGLDERLLRTLLMSDVNDALDLAHHTQRSPHTHAMDLPYSCYFINTSHNTYCTGAQVLGRADVEMYRRVLLMGCRCVEIDAWDDRRSRVSLFPVGPAADGAQSPHRTSVGWFEPSTAAAKSTAVVVEPVVTHHFTTTPTLNFRKVVQTIRECAFPPRYVRRPDGDMAVHPDDTRLCGVSEYPVIISLENNCSYEVQRVMARILDEELGDVLMPPDEMRKGWLNSETGEYDSRFPPSPEQMRRRIIIKTKVVPRPPMPAFPSFPGCSSRGSSVVSDTCGSFSSSTSSVAIGPPTALEVDLPGDVADITNEARLLPSSHASTSSAAVEMIPEDDDELISSVVRDGASSAEELDDMDGEFGEWQVGGEDGAKVNGGAIAAGSASGDAGDTCTRAITHGSKGRSGMAEASTCTVMSPRVPSDATRDSTWQSTDSAPPDAPVGGEMQRPSLHRVCAADAAGASGMRSSVAAAAAPNQPSRSPWRHSLMSRIRLASGAGGNEVPPEERRAARLSGRAQYRAYPAFLRRLRGATLSTVDTSDCAEDATSGMGAASQTSASSAPRVIDLSQVHISPTSVASPGSGIMPPAEQGTLNVSLEAKPSARSHPGMWSPLPFTPRAPRMGRFRQHLSSMSSSASSSAELSHKMQESSSSGHPSGRTSGHTLRAGVERCSVSGGMTKVASSPATKQAWRRGKFTNPELLRLVGMPGFKEGIEPAAEFPFGCVSLNETKARKLSEREPHTLAETCLTTFRRAYPKGMRAAELKDRTGNLTDPVAMWAAGIQLVAFNFQTNDLPMQLNLALFRLNGGCGYVLKPGWMRRIDEAADVRRAQLLLGGVPRALALPTRLVQLRLTILSARFVPKPNDVRTHFEVWMSDEERRQARGGYSVSRDAPIDPAVVVSVYGGRFAGVGASARQVRHGSNFETRAVRKNGLRPVWDETAVVLVSHPELAILHIEIRDKSTNWGGVAGYAALPLRAIQDGKLRMLVLQDSHEKSAGARVNFARLMVSLHSERIPTPPHVHPLFALLGQAVPLTDVGRYRERIDAAGLQLADLKALSPLELQERLGMSAAAAEAFYWVLSGHERDGTDGVQGQRLAHGQRGAMSGHRGTMAATPGQRHSCSAACTGLPSGRSQQLTNDLESAGGAQNSTVGSTATKVITALGAPFKGDWPRLSGLASRVSTWREA